MNEKYKASYMARVNCFLYMATNKPVKITDGKSGIIRRLIDVRPSGKKIPIKEYHNAMAQIDFELGAIAYHCLEVYRNTGKEYYSGYRPLNMILQTDVFFNYVESNFDVFKEQNGVTLKQAYELYKTYCDEALLEYKIPRHKFREELKNYFKTFDNVARVNGQQVRSYYSVFLVNKFKLSKPEKVEQPDPLVLDSSISLLDEVCEDIPAQYTTEEGRPLNKWSKVTTKLKDLNTSKLHFVKTTRKSYRY
jgi:phage/plasmid-associated DNA primase